MFGTQSTTTDYIRADGDFHKEIGERTNKAEIRPEEQSENGDLLGEIME